MAVRDHNEKQRQKREGRKTAAETAKRLNPKSDGVRTTGGSLNPIAKEGIQ
jgi:hypothetical protein